MRAECCLSNRPHGSIARNARVASRTVKLRYRRQNDHDNTRISRPCPATPALKDTFFAIPTHGTFAPLNDV